MVSGQLFISLRICGGWSLHIYCSATHSQQGMQLCCVSYSDESTCHIAKMDKQKREVANKKESVINKEKVMMLEQKLKLNISRVIEQKADFGSVDTAII